MLTFLVPLAAFAGLFAVAFGLADAVLALAAEPPVTLCSSSMRKSTEEKSAIFSTFLAGARFAVAAGFFAAEPEEVVFFTAGFAGAFFTGTVVFDFVGAFFAAGALVAVAVDDFDFDAVDFVPEPVAEDFVVDLTFGFAATFVDDLAVGFAAGLVAGLF